MKWPCSYKKKITNPSQANDMNREIYSFTQRNQFLNERNKAVVGVCVCALFARLCVLITLEIIHINLSSTLLKRETKAKREKKTLRWQPVYQESRDNRIVIMNANCFFFRRSHRNNSHLGIGSTHLDD